MGLSQTERTLRLITIWAWVPAMCLLIPYGIEAAQVVPALALVPMTISAVFGFHKVLSKKSRRGFTIFMDIFIACFLVSIIVPGLVFMARITRWHRSQVQMLGAFGTCPLLLNFTLHTLFVLNESTIFTRLGMLFRSPTCPHCQRDLRLMWDTSATDSTHSNDSKDSYVAVPKDIAADDAEAGPSMAETPRPSTDDETARLL